jgi:hypothetical protein
MQNQLRRNSYYSAFLLVLAAIAKTASADDADIDVVGPTGKSSMAFLVQQYRYNSDQVNTVTHATNGSVKSETTYLTLSAIYAITERVSLTGAIPWTTNSNVTATWLGNSQSKHDSGAGGNFGVAAKLIGQQTDTGPTLVGAIGVSKGEGSNVSQYLTLQPQYRFSPQTLITLNMSIRHQVNSPRTQSLAANFLWRIGHDFTVIPTLRASWVDASNTYSSYRETVAGATLTYHPNPTWSASVAANGGRDSNRITSYYVNSFEHATVLSVFAGARRNF